MLDPANVSSCDGELGLLVAAGYLNKQDKDSYALLVPVFDTADKPMLSAAIAFNRDVAGKWLRQNYPAMRLALVRLTAVRQGMGYPALFTQIWHELFGLATRELASEGTIEDPRAATSTSPGSVAAVWRTSLYHHDWQ